MTANHRYFVSGADRLDIFYGFRLDRTVWITDRFAAWSADFLSEPLSHLWLPEDGTAVHLAWSPRGDYPEDDEGGFRIRGVHENGMKPGEKLAEALGRDGEPLTATPWLLSAHPGADPIALWQTASWDTWLDAGVTETLRRQGGLVIDQAEGPEGQVRVRSGGKAVGLIMPIRPNDAIPPAPKLHKAVDA